MKQVFRSAMRWKSPAHWALLPIAGIGLFAILFLVAAGLYPGGSQHDPQAAGFSWAHNYWCHLLNDRALNGNSNPARPVALAGMFVLCSALAVFWYLLPSALDLGRWMARTVQVSGPVSMTLALFIFTSYHDPLIVAASILAAIALAGTFRGLYRSRWMAFFRSGLFCLFLLGANNFIYYTGHFLSFLPILQKLTFLIVLSWVAVLAWALHRRLMAADSV